MAVAWAADPSPSAPAPGQSRGFSVDTNNRNDVVAFWHAVYQASEGYQERIKWSGNYSGKNGKVSNEFVADVERRINYFRAMCGVPANARVNTDSTVVIENTDPHKPSASTLKSDAAQASALMLILNYSPSSGRDPAITHDPGKSLAGWSEAAWNANARGNLAFGIYGPGAITEYMREEITSGSTISEWNSLTGHRRWITFPVATDFATGDQPGKSVRHPPSNVLYVSQKPNQLVPDPTPDFVAYPSPGFFPAPINSRFWSLSRAEADFNSATVKMTDATGKTVEVSNVKANGNYGDPALIWEVRGAAASKSVFSDATFNVEVSGIRGTGIPSSFSYSVTLINPDRITSNQSLGGPGLSPSNQTTVHTLTPPPGAEELAVTSFLKKSTRWTEGAEKKKKPKVIGRTAKNYPLVAQMSSFPGFGVVSGPRAFHLTFPVSYDLIVRGIPEQSFELDRQIIPASNAKLRFLFRRGYMTKGSTMVIEISGNGGVTWKKVGKSFTGVSNTTYDANVSSASISLPKSDQPIRIRFRYFTKPGIPIYTHEASPSSPTGIFIDDITTKNCYWLEAKKTTALPTDARQFDFNAASAGGSLTEGSRWCLALRTKLGGKWFPYGPMKTVTITAP
jgi:hypothetical protein